MTTQRTPRAMRSVEREIEIDAPVAAVWRALTDATELTRWFPLEARITEGVGGTIETAWEGEPDEQHIEIWDAERHLRTVGRAGGWSGIATDYYLRGARGGTVLRVVSSGFGSEEEWDKLLDGFGHGWDFELFGLRHYLERHRGENREVAFVRVPFDCSTAEAWETLAKPGGWFGPAGLQGLSPGDRFKVPATRGEDLSGHVALWQPPAQFVGLVDGWNGALLRVELFARRATIWLSTHGVRKSDVQALQRTWRASSTKFFQTAA